MVASTVDNKDVGFWRADRVSHLTQISTTKIHLFSENLKSGSLKVMHFLCVSYVLKTGFGLKLSFKEHLNNC